jgi:hypothetical protein
MTKPFIDFEILKLEDTTITVKIRNVIWGEYEDYQGHEVYIDRGNNKYFRFSDNFRVVSISCPQLDAGLLYLPGENTYQDDKIVSYDFREKAKEVFRLLQSIDVNNFLKECSCQKYDIQGKEVLIYFDKSGNPIAVSINGNLKKIEELIDELEFFKRLCEVLNKTDSKPGKTEEA